MATTIVLVRHGETDWNRERRFQGHADRPLTEEGRRQAQELAERMRGEPVTALYASPLLRALETAQVLAYELGLEVRICHALLEIDVGTWEGLTIDEVRARYPERVDQDWRSGWEDGETYDDLVLRVVPALVELGRRHAGGHVVAVTHAGPLRAAIAAAMGLSYDEARRVIGPLENCTARRFAVLGDGLEPAEPL